MEQHLLPQDIIFNLDKLPDSLGVSEKHAAVILGVSVSKLQKDRVKGGGPRFVKVGEGKGGRVSYLLGDLRAFQRSRSHHSTSAYYATDGALTEMGLLHPYAAVGEEIRDFMSSLSEEVDEIVWLTREQAAARARSKQP